MRYLVDEDKPSLENLLHAGVKGMKWGIRKAYTTRLSKGVAKLDKVATGKSSTLSKVAAVSGTRGSDLIRGKGAKGGAAIRRDRIQRHIDRVESGRANAGDILRMVGGIKISDIVRGLGSGPKGAR